MPRDEPVGSFGRLALKPTEFREQVGLIGVAVLHDVPPCCDDSESDQLPRKAGAEQWRGEDRKGMPLRVSGSALAADGSAERVTQGISDVLWPYQ